MLLRRVRRRRQRGSPQASDAGDGDERELEADVEQVIGMEEQHDEGYAGECVHPTYSDDEARVNCRTENISAARTTLGGNPVVAA